MVEWFRYHFRCFIIIFIILSFSLSCDKNPSQDTNNVDKVNISIAKWYKNHRAAITLTYDHGAPTQEMNNQIHQLLIENNLLLDYEIVTSYYLINSFLIDYLLDTLLPMKFGYYGHGHEHINHDNLSYLEALASFSTCYETMQSWGLKPIAYAYPQGAGHELETRRALQDAGFLCGRMHFDKVGGYQGMTEPYILPDSSITPIDWYALPTAVMQDYDFMNCTKCVNNNEQLIPYLENTIRKKAWIILTYHNIGNPQGYGFFRWDEFQKNVQTITSYDFWNASMNDITLYILEKQNTEIEAIRSINSSKETTKIEIKLSDGLENDFFNHPLTLIIEIPDEWVNQQLGLFKNDSLLQTITFEKNSGRLSIRPDENIYELTPVYN